MTLLIHATTAGAVLAASLAFRRKGLWRRSSSRAEQTHIAFVRKKFILQLHVEGFTLNVLHLRVDISRTQLHLGFCSRCAPVDFVAHLVEGRCVVAELERLHRLRKLFLE